MLRVDQAGEFGATRIYAGQLAVLPRNSPAAKLVSRMADQEKRHLKRFDALMSARRVRPAATPTSPATPTGSASAPATSPAAP